MWSDYSNHFGLLWIYFKTTLFNPMKAVVMQLMDNREGSIM